MGVLADGFRTIVAFAGGPAGIFPTRGLEREVQPPEIEVGEIDVTTMRNGVYAAGAEGTAGCRTKVPKKLRSYGDVTVQFAYDTILYSLASTHMGVIVAVTITTPTDQTITFYGWIDKLTPPSHKEGEFPIAEMKIKVACLTARNGGNESSPTSN